MNQVPPDCDQGSGRRRAWIVAGLALVALLLVLFLIVGLGNGNGNEDRLPDEVAEREPLMPEQLCGTQSVHDAIKSELFRRAASARGRDQEAFEDIANYSSARMEAPFVTGENETAGSVTCRGLLWLDLPPGVVTSSRKRTLSGDVGYIVQAGSDGGARLVRVESGEAIVSPLATLSRVRPVTGRQNDDVPLLPETPGEADRTEPPSPPEQPEPAEPPEPRPQTSANPSFNCTFARSRSEQAVCANPGLAGLDRQMAAQFNSALSRADSEQRALLLQTRDRFLLYRERCRNDGCIADTYRGRMREIRDIMAGRWQPPR